jgi:hypothetical protein
LVVVSVPFTKKRAPVTLKGRRMFWNRRDLGGRGAGRAGAERLGQDDSVLDLDLVGVDGDLERPAAVDEPSASWWRSQAPAAGRERDRDRVADAEGAVLLQAGGRDTFTSTVCRLVEV